MKTSIHTLSFVAVGVLSAFIALMFLVPKFPAFGSVQVSQEYMSTTTGETSGNTVPLQLTSNPGSLGSVVITGLTTGWLEFYDATTSDSTLRDTTQTTTTIRIAEFSPSAAVGTYTFDAATSRGLIVYSEGTQPTTTITYR